MDICRVDAVFADPDRGGSASTGSQRVLVVEDENLVAVEMEQWLVEAGHEVGGSYSAEAAIDLAEQSLPDIVIMDIRLAGSKDGVYAAQQIYTSLGIRSLFSSAHADDWTRLRAEPAKPLGWLGKPYGRMEFLRALGMAVGHLEEHSIRSEAREHPTPPSGGRTPPPGVP